MKIYKLSEKREKGEEGRRNKKKQKKENNKMVETKKDKGFLVAYSIMIVQLKMKIERRELEMKHFLGL